MSDATIVTRFAPSPTGVLHVGGARTALFAWAFARQHQGRFIIRLEDTDQARSTAEAARSIVRDLQWLGIDWDEGPDPAGEDPYAQQIGDRGPYCQSQRLDIYNQHIEKLLAAGSAYVPDDEPDIVRFRMEKDIAFEDAVYGPIRFAAADLEDFVIRKSAAGGGFPTFHFAVVVDDALMGVTHVIRGQEHLTNTSKHLALFDALGFDRPTFAHTPSIMNPDGSKMSKRDKAKVARAAAKACESTTPKAQGWPSLGVAPALLEAFLDKKSDDVDIARAIAAALHIDLPEIDVADFRRSGYLPEVLCNYIALLGWNPGENIERFDRDFFIKRFSLDRIGRSNAAFDREKLFRFNADTIASLSFEGFVERFGAHAMAFHSAEVEKLGGTGSERFLAFAAAYQPRARTLDEPFDLGRFIFIGDDAIEYDEKAMHKVMLKNDGEGFAALRGMRPGLEAIDPWESAAIETAVKTFAEENNLGMGKVAQPLRVALSGSTVSPSIGDTLAILGKAATLARIDRCLTRSAARRG